MIVRNCMKNKVYHLRETDRVADAARMVIQHRVGTLPIVNKEGKPIGVVTLHNLLKLTLPDFINLIEDFDFVHDFGSMENFIPDSTQLANPVTAVMEEIITVEETCGLLRAASLMRKHELQDIPVVDENGTLAGIASRVDIGASIMKNWKIQE